MGDDSETWDELMGPSADQLKNMLRMDEPVEPCNHHHHQAEPPAPVVRSSSRTRGAPPPSKAFSMPDRWAQLEPEAEQVNEATRQAVATARGAAAASSSTRRSHSPSDDDMDNSNNSHRAGSVSSRSLHFEDEHEDESASELEEHQHEDDSLRIRQEALRMLEVADDQLADSTYSVYRTKTGGFMASARTLGSQKRVPTALAGIATRAVSSVSATTRGGATATGPAILASTSSRRRITDTMRRSAAKPYRDDPTSSEDESSSSRSMANEKFSREDYEYGDERVVDVVGMEKRFASSRAGEEVRSSSTSKTTSSSGGSGIGNNWSSRYSIDDTLLALSGGAQSGSKFLDKLDQEHHRQRQTAQNMFASSPHDARNTNVFGSGFSFRQKHVFGKQGVVAANTPTSPKEQKGETNLRTVWMDAVPNTPPVTSASPARSWQEQLTLKRKQRRNFILVAFAVLIFIITMATVLGSHKSKQTAAAADTTGAAANQVSDTPPMPPPNTNTGDLPEGSLTFYVTSDVPFDTAGELQLMKDLDDVSMVADFIVHLGNIQNASTTGCNPHRYGEVADILEESPLTVFMVPGEEDWSNCPDQDEAWDAWYENFVSFDEKFEQGFGVTRQYDYQENFAFVDSGVLFVAVHEVNGRLYDPEELRLRNQANLRWVVENGNRYRSGIRAMIILANGRPLLEANDDFYAPLGDFLYNFGVPTAYIHANGGYGEDEMMYQLFEYGGMEHVIAIQTSKGETRGPLRINVGFSETNPFIVG